MHSVEFAVQPTLGDLRARLGVAKGDFVFVGGKKPREDGDLITWFDAKTGIAKCRVMGAVITKPPVVDKQPITTAAPPPMLSKSTTPTSGLLIKGPNAGQETVVQDFAEVYTYLGLKRKLVDLGVISNVQAIKFIGKGGKIPLDADALHVDVTILRAMRTEFAHDEREAKQHKADLEQRLQQCELTAKHLLHGLASKELALLETRQLERDLEIIIEETQDNQQQQQRARHMLEQLKQL